MIHYLFVYGTLSPELAPAEILDSVSKLEYVGDGFVAGKLYDLGDYPGLNLHLNGRSKVKGRVYRLPIDQRILGSIDAYEEYYPTDPSRSLYIRKLATVKLDNGKEVSAWIYEYNGRPVPSTRIKAGRFEKLSV